jgi:hypothetical protein
MRFASLSWAWASIVVTRIAAIVTTAFILSIVNFSSQSLPRCAVKQEERRVAERHVVKA